MLLRRLPLSPSDQARSFSELSVPAVQALPRMNAFFWLGILAAADLAAVFCMSHAVIGDIYQPSSGVLYSSLTLLAIIGVWIVMACSQGLYDPSNLGIGSAVFPRALILCCSILCLVIGIVATATHQPPSRLVLAGIAVGLLIAFRGIWRISLHAVSAQGRCVQRVLVLASSCAAAQIASAEIESRTGYRVRVLAGVPLPGLQDGPSLAWLESAIQTGGIDQIVFADIDVASDSYIRAIGFLRRFAVTLTIIPTGLSYTSGPVRACRLGTLPVFTATTAPLTRGQIAIKCASDVLLALAAITILFPICAIIALAIKLDSRGPVLFRQPRVGFNGAVFLMYKFRTMFANNADEQGHTQTKRDDPRITRVGNFLRRTSLDELPQLLNVLRQQMSIVGPRPHAIGMTVCANPLEHLIEDYGLRHRMKPGITGLAQVNGSRGAVETAAQLRQRFLFDCEYIDRWSPGLDLQIMARTVALIFRDRHAF